MSSTQVTTWRRYTKREKKAYQARVARRRAGTRTVLLNGHRVEVSRFEFQRGTFNFADNLGSRVPTARVNEDVL